MGPAAVRQAIWKDGHGLERIDTLAGSLYLGEGSKRKNNLIKATLVRAKFSTSSLRAFQEDES